MQQCSICLDDLEGGPTLACGHRFHAACLARLAGANGTTPTRRGALTTCPNCRTVSRVALTPVAAFNVGDRVDALWGQKWYPGKVDAVVDGGRAYEIAWDDGCCNEVPAARVRAAPLTVDVDAPTARDARPPLLVTPRVATPVAPPAPPPVPPPPAPRAIVPREASVRPSVRALPANTNTYRCPASCGCGLPHRRCGGCAPCRAKHGDACLAPRAAPPPLPPVTRSHVASMASAWVAVCTDLLEAAKDCTNMRGLREPLVSGGFICGPDHAKGVSFSVTVPAEFPCYYDVIGKDYKWAHAHAKSLVQLRNYLEGALALARAGGAYRTEAEYESDLPVRAKTSRFTGVAWNDRSGKWRASIRVQGTKVDLGAYDDEEDAARAYDAALVRYKNAPTVNFPGEAPLASVLAALPELSSPHPVQPASAPQPPGAPRRSGRAPVPKVIVDPESPRRKDTRGERPAPALKKKVIKWKLSGCTVAVTPVMAPDTSRAYRGSRHKRGRYVEGAEQKKNGKWINPEMFPGREFDDLDEYRAAKKQRVEQRIAYSEQNIGRRK